MIKTLIFAALYIGAVHYGYVSYINPTFEYAAYYYLPFSTAALWSSYFLAWLPVLAYRPCAVPTQAFAALIYIASYIPIQLSLLYSVDRDYDELIWIQIMLAVSMICIFIFSQVTRRPVLVAPDFKKLDFVIGVLTALSLALVIIDNIGHMRFVSFQDVYDVRRDAANVSQSAISAYLISWLSYCFISYWYARGLIYKKWSFVLIGFAASIALYMATGAKAAILLLPITIGLNWVWGRGKNFLFSMLMLLTIGIFGILLFLPDEGVSMWIKSIALVRILGTAGWTASKYFEYFDTYGHTFYSHIGPINWITGMYPYGELGLGQVVGLEYVGSSEANFNAGFWASDGFAALGPIGILVVTPFIIGVMWIINKATFHLDPRFTILWMGGFFIAMLNVPLTTALLSGGGLVMIILAKSFTRNPARKL